MTRAEAGRVRMGRLYFPGGNVDASGFVEAHADSVTPSTFVEPSRQARAVAFLELAREQLREAQTAGTSTARIVHTMSAQSCIDSALGLLR